MNKLILNTLTISLLILFSVSLLAESKKDSFKPSLIGLNNDQKKLFDYLEIEKIVLEGRHRVPSTEAYKNFARIYEEYVKLFCYDSVNYKFQSPLNPNLSESCLYYLRKLKHFNPENPLLICSENGLGSEECRNAYLSQYISRESVAINEQNKMTSFEAKIGDLAQERMKVKPEELDQELKSVTAKFKKEENPENWLELKSLISEKIDYECQRVGVSYVDFRPPDFMMGANLIEHQRYTTDDLYKQAYDLLHDPNRLGNLFTQGSFDKKEEVTEAQIVQPHPFEIVDETDQVEFTPKPFWRIRRVTTDCYQSILDGLKFNIALPVAVCNLHSNYSPFCLNADDEFAKNLPIYIRKPKVEKKKYEMGTF